MAIHSICYALFNAVYNFFAFSPILPHLTTCLLCARQAQYIFFLLLVGFEFNAIQQTLAIHPTRATPTEAFKNN